MRVPVWLLACGAWCAAAAGGHGEEDTRLVVLYDKLKRLEQLDGGGGADADEQRLELVAGVAAQAPGLSTKQLRLLLEDLRRAAATSPAHYPDYDDDDYPDYVDEEMPVDSEEGEANAWEAEDQPAAVARQTALRHWLEVQREARCAEPAREVVCARDAHERASAVFLPHCAVLHRCSARAGCCHDPALVCAPLAHHLRIVYLPFYVLTLGGDGNTEEFLAFVNHTRCECATAAATRVALAAADDMLRDAERSPSTPARTSEPPLVADETTAAPAPQPHTDRCRCWRGWEQSAIGMQCACACVSRKCASLARGREHFGLRARTCVSRGECGTPRCEFGEYERAVGLCPRRKRLA